MKGITLISGAIALCLLQFFHSANSQSENNAIAAATKVEPRRSVKWFYADYADTTYKNIAVHFPENLNATFFKKNVLVFMYTAKNTKDKNAKEFFNSSVCDLLDPNNDKYPKDNFLPRQIVDLMLPGRYGSCDIKKGTTIIKRNGLVSTAADSNPNLDIPELPFELRAYVARDDPWLIEDIKDDPTQPGTFYAYYNINGVPKKEVKPPTTTPTVPTTTPTVPTTTPAVPTTTTSEPTTTPAVPTTTTSEPTTTPTVPEEPVPTSTTAPKPEGSSGYYCLNTQWNYYIVWRVCTIAEFFESICYKIGWRILRIF